MDGSFKTTGLGPWTYLLSPSMVDSGAFWHKTSGTSDDAYAAPTEASLLESGVPNTPTHPLNYPEELGAQLELKNYLVYFQHSAPHITTYITYVYMRVRPPKSQVPLTLTGTHTHRSQKRMFSYAHNSLNTHHRTMNIIPIG